MVNFDSVAQAQVGGDAPQFFLVARSQVQVVAPCCKSRSGSARNCRSGAQDQHRIVRMRLDQFSCPCEPAGNGKQSHDYGSPIPIRRDKLELNLFCGSTVFLIASHSW